MSDKRYVSDFVIRLDAQPIPSDLMNDVSEITVENSLHLPDMATITIKDSQLKWIDDKRFEPGVAVTIRASTDRSPDEKTLFEGEIVEIEPFFTEGSQHLVVRAFDRLHRLMRGRYVRSFLNVTDRDVIMRICAEVGLTAKISEMEKLYTYIFQGRLTNLEFLQQRAAAYGYLLYVDGSVLVCGPPKQSGTAIALPMLEELSEFRPRLTTIGQITKVIARGWDPQKKEVVIGTASNGSAHPEIGVSGSGSALAKKAFNIDATYLVADRPLRNQDRARTLAQSVADSHDAHFVQAEGKSRGNPHIRAGAALNIEKVGKRFSGTYFVTASTHIYSSQQGYTTSFVVSGLQPTTLISLLAPENPQTVPTSTLVVGIVTDNSDPENLGRVKVKYPCLSDDHGSDWARVLVVNGGKNRGFQFLPEVNDEVLVGFEMGDLNYPYVLGGLWNGRDTPPLPTAEAVKSGRVFKHVIRSKTGHEISIDDSDDKGGITIKDRNGNSIVLTIEQDKLTITSKGDMTLDTKGNLTLKTAKRLVIQAGQDGEIKAMGLKLDGQASGAEVTGTTIKVNASANVDIKGSMINLN